MLWFVAKPEMTLVTAEQALPESPFGIKLSRCLQVSSKFLPLNAGHREEIRRLYKQQNIVLVFSYVAKFDMKIC